MSFATAHSSVSSTLGNKMNKIEEIIQQVDEPFFDRVFERIGGNRLAEVFPELDGKVMLADYLIGKNHVIELKILESEFLENPNRIEREYAALVELKKHTGKECLDISDTTLPQQLVNRYLDVKFDQLQDPIRSAKKQIRNATEALDIECETTLLLVNKGTQSVSFQELFNYADSYLKRKKTGILNLYLLSLNIHYTVDTKEPLFPTRTSSSNQALKMDFDFISKGIFEEFEATFGPIFTTSKELDTPTLPMNDGLHFSTDKGTTITFKKEYPTNQDSQ